MKKKYWKQLFILLTIAILLIIGLKFDGNLLHLLKQREDFISNVQMGGERYSFSFASLKYYLSYISEPFAFINILGNIGPFTILAFLASGVFLKKNLLKSLLYCLLLGIGIELFQYATWFGAFDLADILLRLIGALLGLLIYSLTLYCISR